MKNKFKRLSLFKPLTIGLFFIISGTNAYADALINFDLSDPDAEDVRFDGNTFGTIDNGVGSTLGHQNTGLNFIGSLDGVLSDIFSGASFTLENVTADGAPVVSSSLIALNTSGGHFLVYDDQNQLLLEGELGSGVITGSQNSSTGSFFNTEFASFTGGSLLQFILHEPAGLSLALANIISGNQAGMSFLVDEFGRPLSLNPFVADVAGAIDGSPIPEPMTGVLLLSALAAGAGYRRKRS